MMRWLHCHLPNIHIAGGQCGQNAHEHFYTILKTDLFGIHFRETGEKKRELLTMQTNQFDNRMCRQYNSVARRKKAEEVASMRYHSFLSVSRNFSYLIFRVQFMFALSFIARLLLLLPPLYWCKFFSFFFIFKSYIFTVKWNSDTRLAYALGNDVVALKIHMHAMFLKIFYPFALACTVSSSLAAAIKTTR